jgi:XTP/dITP diphosphohydrolase
MKVILATTNPGKLRELSEMANGEPWLELSLAPSDFHAAETGQTFVENAKIKARAAARATGIISVADDSGLIVEALNGQPGINSARYCQGTDADRRLKLLEAMKAVPEDRRQAAFMCAMVVCDPDGGVAFSTIRYWEGLIVREPRGENGFGYDPVFCPINKSMTAAELPAAEKNQISHRGQAWRQVLAFLRHHHHSVSKQG